MSTNAAKLSRWTMPVLRIGMGVFLAYWGFDKIVATEGSQGIFSAFYKIDAGPSLLQLAGGAEVVFGLMLAAGLFRVPAAWVQLVINGISTVASWKQILDPWAIWGLREGGNAHLFLASIVITAASIVLVLNARDDTLTLDRSLGLGSKSAGPLASGPREESGPAGGSAGGEASPDRGAPGGEEAGGRDG